MHLNVTFGIALVMSAYLNLKMKADWNPFSLKVISCVSILVLGYISSPSTLWSHMAHHLCRSLLCAGVRFDGAPSVLEVSG